MFTLKIRFPDASHYDALAIVGHKSALQRAGWCPVLVESNPKWAYMFEREIPQLYLAEVHWSQRFLGLEPMEISVVFQNSLFPLCFGYHQSLRFLSTSNKWARLESDIFPGFRYDVRSNVVQKTLEIRVSGGQQLGKENMRKFLLTLSLYHTATKIARHLHQFRMAAGKQDVPIMDRYYNEILETLGRYLPR